MRYMLTIIADEGAREDASPEEQKASMDAWNAITEELRSSGAFIAGEGLQPSTTATTVRFDGEQPSVTDGPFAESKEQLGGFYLLDCENLDQALEWAKKLPVRGGAVEVRPALEYDEGDDSVTWREEAKA
jgi:hypothetical protein